MYVSQCIGSLLPVYPSYGFQGDVSGKQIRLQHYFCLKFFGDCFCLQEQPGLLNLAFKATRSASPLSSLLTPSPLTPGLTEQFPLMNKGARLPLTFVPRSPRVPLQQPLLPRPALLFPARPLSLPLKQHLPRAATPHSLPSQASSLCLCFDTCPGLLFLFICISASLLACQRVKSLIHSWSQKFVLINAAAG